MQVTSFCSGAGNITDLEALIEAGASVCVELGRMDNPVRSRLAEYAKAGGRVIVDSGAFGAFKKGLSLDFDAVMIDYEQMVWATQGNVAIVAPDKIGEQEATLSLLNKYAAKLRQFISMRAEIIVPLQKGDLSPYAAWRESARTLGTEQFTVAVPSNKEAFTDDDLADLVGGPMKPERLHFLGMTLAGKNWPRKRAIMLSFSPETIITMDGCRLTAKVGKGRAITEGQKEKKKDLVFDGFAGAGPLDAYEDGGDLAFELLDEGDLTEDELDALFSLEDDLSRDELKQAYRCGELFDVLPDEILLSDLFNWTQHEIMRNRAEKEAGPLARYDAIVSAMESDVTVQKNDQGSEIWGGGRPVVVQASLF